VAPQRDFREGEARGGLRNGHRVAPRRPTINDSSALRLLDPARAGTAGTNEAQPEGAHRRPRRRVLRYEALYHAGDPLDAIYVVHVGFLKSVTKLDNGLAQVTGFHMAGDVIGLDGIESGRHASGAIALEDADAFELPLTELRRWAQDFAHGQRQVTRLLAYEIGRCQAHMLMLGTMRAEQRIAAFLLELSERYGRQGYSRTRLELRMTREEMGSYLGLKLETVSRLLSRFQQKGLVRAHGRSISLVDLRGLWQVSGIGPDEIRPAGVALLDREGEFLPP